MHHFLRLTVWVSMDYVLIVWFIHYSKEFWCFLFILRIIFDCHVHGLGSATSLLGIIQYFVDVFWCVHFFVFHDKFPCSHEIVETTMLWFKPTWSRLLKLIAMLTSNLRSSSTINSFYLTHTYGTRRQHTWFPIAGIFGIKTNLISKNDLAYILAHWTFLNWTHIVKWLQYFALTHFLCSR